MGDAAQPSLQTMTYFNWRECGRSDGSLTCEAKTQPGFHGLRSLTRQPVAMPR